VPKDRNKDLSNMGGHVDKEGGAKVNLVGKEKEKEKKKDRRE